MCTFHGRESVFVGDITRGSSVKWNAFTSWRSKKGKICSKNVWSEFSKTYNVLSDELTKTAHLNNSLNKLDARDNEVLL